VTTVDRNRSVWKWGFRIGRFQFKAFAYRHRYPHLSDRWVFQPHFIYDRRANQRAD
jgi:hypothetical protein